MILMPQLLVLIRERRQGRPELRKRGFMLQGPLRIQGLKLLQRLRRKLLMAIRLCQNMRLQGPW